MVQEIYADLYVLINFGMDLLCLTVTASLLHLPARRWRILLASGMGGLYSLLSLLFSPAGLLGLLFDLLAAMALAGVAFAQRGNGLLRHLRVTGAYFLSSVLLGGVMTALYAFLNRLALPLDRMQKDGLEAWIFALLGATAGLATLKGGRLFAFSARRRYVTLTATLFGRTVTLRALIDSGNLLQDPLSGRGVIVVDRRALRGLLPEKLLAADTPQRLTDLLEDYELARLIRLIPVRSATGEGLLPAVIPEQLRVTDRRTTYSGDQLLAISDLGEDARDFDAVMANG
ncbi:MAG: sigma-E processing peptidase SpoIIGA [Clostridia bacterium]|mgnify:CR=1 FL=1|jgi:stage II sporulation protein GA (sporulation sigma-E factor processing peptidase)|nr:sigma-E processing peptidase SpoIIGA [Clostridia bacterium]